ncbi:MAG: flagellar biosynthetic protein FliQ [Planctomycetaceae bacterium]|nr:flagellar biosynthetic protein FliQ [Planctomycetaceae bacterium]MBV8268930.1 flagellar biosynthetic protein FliQ [Planctomycetaceae bacterium]MBV8318309.1 flagellar biosynthetic protein FliQ [Planctomycetaceae bacterium]MBV8557150.1 flagellar biosynthetic protein FliQ [Planctomycetaceae bacterium]
MELAQVIDWSREALRMALLLGGPPLAAALLVGLLVGIAQTLTQLHEPVIGLVPRLVAVLLVVLAILPWLVGRWIAFAVGLIEGIPERL